VTPRGFLFSVAEAGIKKPGRPDMALIYSEAEASASGVFTRNRVKAAPVRLDMKRIRSGRARAIVVNSGNANACTGAMGMRNAEEMAALAGAGLGVPEGLVYVSSTGVIGVQLPMQRVRPGIKEMAAKPGRATIEDAARAIMTTDTFPKLASRKLRIGRLEGTMSGICKGAGMIHPQMATMLAFILTDIAVEKNALRAALREAVEDSFNRVTVEGDTSTNDTVLALANGMLGNREITRESGHFRTFKAALSEVTCELSRMIARDGEGATKLIEIEIMGAKTDGQARKGAFTVANSVLVKTALYGRDPNPGRIMAALGRAGIEIREEKIDIHIGGAKVISRGLLTGRLAEAREALKGGEVRIVIDLGSGRARAKVLTCDLSEEFVRLNAEYTT
jgi:glutamate N-acetyltransferase/amino-acid N-acetyltransferase